MKFYVLNIFLKSSDYFNQEDRKIIENNLKNK